VAYGDKEGKTADNRRAKKWLNRCHIISAYFCDEVDGKLCSSPMPINSEKPKTGSPGSSQATFFESQPVGLAGHQCSAQDLSLTTSAYQFTGKRAKEAAFCHFLSPLT
jgi:hypothetical protein